MHYSEYTKHGFRVFPIKLGGTKEPACKWTQFRKREPTPDELESWFGNGCPYGLAVMGGEYSNNLAVLDFDGRAKEIFAAWQDIVCQQISGVFAKIAVVRSPRPGGHVWLRTPSAVKCSKLAHADDELLVELKGQGGYVLAPGGNPAAHEFNKPYEFIHGGPATVVPVTDHELDVMIGAAGELGDPESVQEERKRGPQYDGPPRPGDVYNAKHDDFVAFLIEQGWTIHHHAGETVFFVRPNRNKPGWSATWNFDGRGFLHVFSKNVPNLPHDRSYTPFEVLTRLKYGGDHARAAADVRARYEPDVIHAQAEYRQQWKPNEHEFPSRPVLGEAAYYGVAGDIVLELSEYTEAHPAALLLQLLTACGNILGRGPHMFVAGSRHYAKLFIVLVGRTGLSRKGTSWSFTQQVLVPVAPLWITQNTTSGLGSGEAIVHLVRDASGDDPGVADKRAMIQEEEFAKVLQVGKRQGSILSMVLRDAWDDRVLRNTVKRNPMTASCTHISLVAHITEMELQDTLAAVDIHNGFGNRFLWACVDRYRILPDDGQQSEHDIQAIGEPLKTAVEQAQDIGQMGRTPAANELWRDIYIALPEPEGVIGSLVSRAPAQMTRLSLLYAALDGRDRVDVPHLQAAQAVWQYAEDSIRYLFQRVVSDSLPDKVEAAIADAMPGGLHQADMYRMFDHLKHTAAKLGEAVEKLIAERRLVREQVQTRGRSRTVYKVPSSQENDG